MKKILFVEDDKNISEMVTDYLVSESYGVKCMYNGREAVSTIKENKYDLALIDLMLPGCSGFDVIREIRKVSTMPIIIVTAKDNDADKTLGLNLGADDYVTKPFSVIELLARIKANIRRVTQYSKEVPDEAIIRIKDLEINTFDYSLKQSGIPVNLTHTEFEILKILAANVGKAFSKEQLYNKVWKEPYFGNENVLNTHMNRLRNKLNGHNAEKFIYILTLWGIGYKMEEK